MCGISGLFARESVPSWKYIDTLFSWTEKRGQDGVGFYLNNRDGSSPVIARFPTPYSKNKEVIKEMLDGKMKIGSLLLMASRAQPETEAPTNDADKIQPIRSLDDGNGCCVVLHNGAVSNRIYLELKEWAEKNNYKYTSNIDSEAIIVSYLKFNRNLKDAMQYISGGFASLLYDEKMDRLFLIVDFKPLSWGYIRGVGLFINSMIEPIEEITYGISAVPRCGIAVWEDFYFHPINGPRIQDIDLRSGFVRKTKYSPRYIIGNRWDSNKEILSTGVLNG